MEEVIMNIDNMLCGKLLGDGRIQLEAENRKGRFYFKQSERMYVLDTLLLIKDSNLDIQFEKTMPRPILGKRLGGEHPAFEVVSLSSKYFSELYKIWYKGDLKIIPKDYIKKNLNSQSLALWYQDDGHLKVKDDRIIISTESFTKKEVHFLINILKEKFNIESRIDHVKENQYRIDISKNRYTHLFLTYVSPYLCDSMSRKSHQKKYKELSNQNCDLLYRRNEMKEDLSHISLNISKSLKDKLLQHDPIKVQEYLFRKVSEELIYIRGNEYRKNLIKRSLSSEFIKEREKEKLTKYQPRIFKFVDRGLDVLIKWTGLEKGEYLQLLLEDALSSFEFNHYSASEIADDLLDIPRTTLNNWLNVYSDYFAPVYYGISTRKFYSKEAIEVLKKVKMLKDSGIKSSKLIKDRLD